MQGVSEAGQTGRQQAALGSAASLQTQQLGAAATQAEAQRKLEQQMQLTGIGGQSMLQGQSNTFQGGQNALNRQQQTATQLRDINSQMAQLQANLAQTEKSSQRSAQMQWQLANLQNARDLTIQGMQGQ